MKRLFDRSAWVDPRSTEELVQILLTTWDDDEWPTPSPLTILHFRGTREVFDTAKHLCQSKIATEREVGAALLGQLDAPEFSFREECVNLLLDMIKIEQVAGVLAQIGTAFGHLGDPRCIEPLARFKSHPDFGVRWGVVMGMWGHEDDLAVQTLIDLSRDEADSIRDWATTGLATVIESDTPEIRAALLARTDDDDPETRGEALLGLARRKIPETASLIRRELLREFHGIWAVEAAGLLADSSLYPLIQSVWQNLNIADRSRFSSYFDNAFAACKPSKDGKIDRLE